MAIAKSQDNVEILSNKICDCLSDYQSLYDDSMLIQHCFQISMQQATDLPKSRKSLEKLINKVDGNLQKNCKQYVEVVTRVSPNKGDWTLMDSNMATILDSNLCQTLTSHKKLYYLEHSGDTTQLEIKDGWWKDHFAKGTYSLCKFKWSGACDFEIEFVKTTETSRLSNNPGEKFYYKIIDQRQGHYLLFFQYGAMKGTFKIYYED